MAVRSDGKGRMKNMSEESERREGGRECRWLETSVSYKSFNLWETGLNVSVEVIRKKGKGAMYNWLNTCAQGELANEVARYALFSKCWGKKQYVI